MNQAAVGADQNVRFLYVLNDRNEAVRRDVTLGTQQGQLQVIRAGLSPEERVF